MLVRCARLLTEASSLRCHSRILRLEQQTPLRRSSILESALTGSPNVSIKWHPSSNTTGIHITQSSWNKRAAVGSHDSKRDDIAENSNPRTGIRHSLVVLESLSTRTTSVEAIYWRR